MARAERHSSPARSIATYTTARRFSRSNIDVWLKKAIEADTTSNGPLPAGLLAVRRSEQKAAT